MKNSAVRNIGTILDYSVEGKSADEDFERTKNETILNLERAKNDDKIPFAVFKITGIAPLGTLEKVSNHKKLTLKEMPNGFEFKSASMKFANTLIRIEQPIFIDAEESWIQDAIDSSGDGNDGKIQSRKTDCI